MQVLLFTDVHECPELAASLTRGSSTSPVQPFPSTSPSPVQEPPYLLAVQAPFPASPMPVQDSPSASPTPVQSRLSANTVASIKASQTVKASLTASPTVQDTFTASPTFQDSFTASPTVQDSFTASPTALDSFTASPTVQDFFTASPSAQDSFTAIPTPVQMFPCASPQTVQGSSLAWIHPSHPITLYLGTCLHPPFQSLLIRAGHASIFSASSVARLTTGGTPSGVNTRGAADPFPVPRLNEKWLIISTIIISLDNHFLMPR